MSQDFTHWWDTWKVNLPDDMKHLHYEGINPDICMFYCTTCSEKRIESYGPYCSICARKKKSTTKSVVD